MHTGAVFILSVFFVIQQPPVLPQGPHAPGIATVSLNSFETVLVTGEGRRIKGELRLQSADFFVVPVEPNEPSVLVNLGDVRAIRILRWKHDKRSGKYVPDRFLVQTSNHVYSCSEIRPFPFNGILYGRKGTAWDSRFSSKFYKAGAETGTVPEFLDKPAGGAVKDFFFNVQD